MGSILGPIVLLFSTMVAVPPHLVDPNNPDEAPPIVHVQLPDNVNYVRVAADNMVWAFAAHENHPDVVVRNTLDRTLNGQWGKFVACKMSAWESCEVELGPFEADITDVYLVYWQPYFTDEFPERIQETYVNVTAGRADELNVRPVVNVDVEIDLFDWFLRRLFGR